MTAAAAFAATSTANVALGRIAESALNVFDNLAGSWRALPASEETARLAGMRNDDALALIWKNDLGERHLFTGRELARWADKTAAFLAARGVAAGDAVAVSLGANYQLWFVLLALDKLGARAVELPEGADEAEVARVLRASSARAVVCTNQGGVAEMLDHVVFACPDVELRALVHGDGAPALFALPDEADATRVPPACHEDGLPHGAQLSGENGVCALGCVRRGWVDFNTCVRLTSADAWRPDADAASGASLASGECAA